MTRCDTGHVAESAGSQAQQRGVLFGSVAGQPHQCRRSQVGYVTDHGHDLIVAVGRQGHDVGTQLGDDRCHLAERVVSGRRRRSQHPHRAFEHRRVGAVEAIELATRHWVTADEAWVVDRRGDSTLHAAHIGDETGRFGESTLDLVDDGEHGRGNERDVGIGVESVGIDGPDGEGPLDPQRVEIVAGHVPSTVAKRERDRTTHQTETGHVGTTSAVHGRSA